MNEAEALTELIDPLLATPAEAWWRPSPIEVPSAKAWPRPRTMPASSGSASPTPATASDRRDVRVGQGYASQDKQHGKAQQQTAAVAPPKQREGEASGDLGFQHGQRPAEPRRKRALAFQQPALQADQTHAQDRELAVVKEVDVALPRPASRATPADLRLNGRGSFIQGVTNGIICLP